MIFKLLHYFWRIATAGSVERAQPRLIPQTISEQIEHPSELLVGFVARDRVRTSFVDGTRFLATVNQYGVAVFIRPLRAGEQVSNG